MPSGADGGLATYGERRPFAARRHSHWSASDGPANDSADTLLSEATPFWDLSGHYYGDPFEWPRVWSFNPEITNPNWIYPLDQVRLLREGTTQTQLPDRHFVRAERPTNGPLEVYLREEGFLDPETIAHAGELTGSTADHMLLMPYESVYIKYNDDADAPAPGQELSLFHEVAPRDRANHESGTLVRIYGTVRIIPTIPRNTLRAR